MTRPAEITYLLSDYRSAVLNADHVASTSKRVGDIQDANRTVEFAEAAIHEYVQGLNQEIHKLSSGVRVALKMFEKSQADKCNAETAWLVEFASSVSRRTTYWGKTPDGLGMTEENLDALRFARKQDAEAFIDDNGWTECKAVEHMWQERGRDDSC